MEKHSGAGSVFESRTLEDVYDEVRSVYQADKRPWIIGYSGGKDSTATVQLVWNALKGLPAERLSKRVNVISGDTLVETPVVVGHIDTTLRMINDAARREALPFVAQKVRPVLEDTFWVNLVGRGYPAPTRRFRWCTERLKIKPANQFIIDQVHAGGEVVVVLGVRRAESATRAQVMSLHRIGDSLLSSHTTLTNAFVYTPIEAFTVDDVWSYLLQVPSPWGANNRDLLAMYRNANAGECPLVVDDTTPSCGNSRFGCWVCTVVEKDKSMEGLIDSGEEWLEPLLEFRDFLAVTQDPKVKHRYRDYKRRDGRVTFINRGADASSRIARGPYKLEFCRTMLRELLRVQQRVRGSGPDPNMELITEAELHEIRRIWRVERQDWPDSVPTIYRDTVGQDLDWVADDAGAFAERDMLVLKSLCEQNDVPVDLVAKLLDAEQRLQGLARRSSIFDRIRTILSEEWRSEEDVLRERHAEIGECETPSDT